MFTLFLALLAAEIRDGIVRRLKVNVSVQKQVGLQCASGLLLFLPRDRASKDKDVHHFRHFLGWS